LSKLLLCLPIRQVTPPARPSRTRLAVLVGAAALISATLGGAQDRDRAVTPAPAPASPVKDNKPAEFVGSAVCQTCHEDTFNAFQKNAHEVVETDKKRGWANKACESCHGPGSKHADSADAAEIRQPAKLKAGQTDRICLTCHQNQSTHVGRINSSHAKDQVSCVACHAVHSNGPHGLVPRKLTEVNALCAGCHAEVWASFQRPFKHRLPEGAMSCVDCHNPHGGSILARAFQTTKANEPGCFKCHGDKAGPFAFEHAPVRLEGCTACHQPHGSSNPRMLTRPDVRFVCMECHSNLPAPTAPANHTLGTAPPAFHDLLSPRFQNCTLCHQKVHGSYANRAFLK